MNKLTLFSVLALTLALTSQGMSAQRDHRGEHRFHVWRNERWVWEYHPVDWVVPTELLGPTQVDISLGWRSHPGWQRYHVYRHNHWGYVYHPSGWNVPGAWVGPHGHHHD